MREMDGWMDGVSFVFARVVCFCALSAPLVAAAARERERERKIRARELTLARRRDAIVPGGTEAERESWCFHCCCCILHTPPVRFKARQGRTRAHSVSLSQAGKQLSQVLSLSLSLIHSKTPEQKRHSHFLIHHSSSKRRLRHGRPGQAPDPTPAGRAPPLRAPDRRKPGHDRLHGGPGGRNRVHAIFA